LRPTAKGDLDLNQVIDRAGPEGDGEHRDAIGTRGGVLNLGAAIGPKDRGYRGRVVDADGVALDGLGEFPIDILDAIHTIVRGRIGSPSSAIKAVQIRCGGTAELTKTDGDGGNRGARCILAGIAAAGNDQHHRKHEQDDA